MKRLLVFGGTLAAVAAASSTVAFAAGTTSQPWTVGQAVDIWAAAPGTVSPEGPVSIDLYLGSSPNQTTVTATRIGDQKQTFVFGTSTVTEYQFTMPSMGAQRSYSIYGWNPSGGPMVLFTGPSIDDNEIGHFSYAPPVSGQLPEVPFAGALPFIGLAGAGAFLFTRKRKNANRFAN